ncbi:MAG TPA: efflux RND transporter periplasmic adaptor subunit [Burkholderiaceae bacterium]|nr:efflux RND transporter periplasmic adaptor subunit [Burkholderiaceae bacterium]
MPNASISPFRSLGPALAIASAFLLAACGKPPMAAATAAAPAPTMGVVTIEPQRVALTTELPGRTVAYQIAEVRPQVGGLIQARLFREGSDVKAGDVLYRIDSAPYQAAYGNAQAALAKAEANLLAARTKAQRYQELVAIQAVSQQDNDDAAAALKQAEAEVAAAKATLETARINLGYTRITAPISGRIGRSSVTPGALVTASQSTSIATIQQLDPIYVDVTQPSAALLQLQGAMEAGQITRTGDGAAKVELKLEDGSTYALPGKLQFSESTVDPSTGAVTLRVVFPNPKAKLLPGMYVRAVVEEGVKADALLVPQRAVQRDAAGKPLAYVVSDDGKLQMRTLVAERAIGDRWLVTEGLQAGERVVVEGLQSARDGVAVNAVPWTPAAAAPGADTQRTAQAAAASGG